MTTKHEDHQRDANVDGGTVVSHFSFPEGRLGGTAILVDHQTPTVLEYILKQAVTFSSLWGARIDALVGPRRSLSN